MKPSLDRVPSDPCGPIEVIIINDFAEVTGGSSKVALAEAEGLARRGHHVTLIAGRGRPPSELADAGVAVWLTGQSTTREDPNRLRAAAQGIWNQAATKLVREVAAQVDPGRAIIHVHGFTKVLSASAVRAAVSSGLPTIATLHDYFGACPNGGFFNYQTSEICRLDPLSRRCITTNCDARTYSHKLWRVSRTAVQNRFGGMPAEIEAFIAPSRSAAELMRRFLPQQAPLHILPNPITGSRRSPVEVANNDQFVLVGRLARDKGGLMFAEAARNANVSAVLVGDGDEAERINHANPEAQLTGWVDPERVRSIVRGARAAVNASLIDETQGLTILEAAADGVPSIVPDASVYAETVEDGVTGLWFRRGDRDDLAAKLALLDRDRELAARLGIAAYKRFWAEPSDPSSHLDTLEEIYRDTLGGRESSTATATARGARL